MNRGGLGELQFAIRRNRIICKCVQILVIGRQCNRQNDLMRKGFEILKFVELLYRNQRWILVFFCTKLDGPMTE